MRSIAALLALPVTLIPAMVAAQTSAAPAAPAAAPSRSAAAAADQEDDSPEIVVKGQKPVGSVVGEIPPEVTLSPADVRSYGVNNVSDLLAELAPQTTSGRGRGGGGPVVLLNGRRISSFLEIRDLPTEAILRVEILPEEVSLKYGYSADQRVVNFVLRPRFRAFVGQAGATTSTEGGGTSENPEANLIRINHDQRLSLNLRYTGNSKLRESDRDVTSIASGTPYDLTGNIVPAGSAAQIDPALSALAGQTVTVAGVPGTAATRTPTLADYAATANRANSTDISPYRTLKGSSQAFSGSAVYSHPVFGRSTATVSASLNHTSGDSLTGLPGVSLLLPTGSPFSPFANDVAIDRYLSTDPLHQRTEALTGHLGVSVNGDRGHWRWSLTGNYDYADNRTRTQTGVDVSAFQTQLNALDPSANPFSASSSLIGGLLVDRAHSTSNSGDLNAVAGGPIFKLPAGNVSTNIKLGLEATKFDASSLRSGIAQSNGLSRTNENSQVNLDIPLASRQDNFLPFLGRLSGNVNVAVRHLSDFGTLNTFGYGFFWQPNAKLNLIASWTRDEGAPTLQQVGNPLVVTPQVRVFDYVNGTTVDVTQIDGGNRGLHADDRHVFKLGATVKPFTSKDLTIIANYVRTHTKNAIATLPDPTLEIQNAFADRYVRDASGQLVSVDVRPVNFARESQEELRFGLNFSVPLKGILQRKFEQYIADRRAGKNPPFPFKLPQLTPAQRARLEKMRERSGATGQGQPGSPGADGGPPPGGPPPGEGGPPPGGGFGGPPGGGRGGGFGGPGGGFGGPGGGGRGGGGFGGGRQGQGRLQVAVYDTWTLKNEVLIRQGVPVLDLLHGSTLGSGGGTPEHQVELQLGYSNNGLGVRLSGNWQSGTFVRGVVGSTTGDLTFSPLTTTTLRLFADVGQMPMFIGKPWARGLRVTFTVNNITDQRLKVRDANGNTPLRYQPAYLDPLGRTVGLTIRKLWF